MNFTIISKDHKESWADYADLMKRIKEQGYGHSVDVSGDEFGIDSEFIIFSDSEEVYDHYQELVQAGYFEVVESNNEEDYTPEEWENIVSQQVISTYSEGENGDIHIILKNGHQHTMTVPPWDNN